MNTLSSAKEFERNGKIKEWVQIFLRGGENSNIVLADELQNEKNYYYGPVNLPLSLFEVASGPGIDHHTENDIKWFYYVVNEMKKSYQANWDMPPMIACYNNGKLLLNDGTHRYTALQQLGVTEYYAIIWMTKKQDYEEFMKQYHKAVD
jgi:hypothetical protein